MDTKWRNIRNVSGFIVFFLGVSLTLGNIPGLIRRLPDRISDLSQGKLLEYDYQQSDDFRWHISSRLENFLSIAVKGCPAGWNYYDETEGMYYYGSEAWDQWNNIAAVQDLQVTEGTGTYSREWWEEDDWEDWEEYLEEQQEYWDNWQNWYYNEYGEWLPMPIEQGQEPKKPLTEEEKEKLLEERAERVARQKQRLTEMYFQSIREDKNLLYSIYYDGSLLYSNTELLPADGGMQAPEGYNFLLYFDGEKVRILKDGKEADVYGDGYYRGGNEWNVPGYRNFPVDEGMKKAVVYIAAAKEPLQYTVGMYENGGYHTQENSLYWMQYNAMSERLHLRRNLIGFAAGLALLLLSFFCRKGRREFTAKLAALQGRIWVECKIALGAAVLWSGLHRIFENDGTVWQEVTWLYADGGMRAVAESGYGSLLLSDLLYLSEWFWAALFWVIYLAVNDLKYNRRVWRHGLIANCCRLISAKELKLPLARRMARRSGILMGMAAFSGICALMTAVSLANYRDSWQNTGVRIFFPLFILSFFVLFLGIYFMGKKNVRAAEEVDALAKRIDEICGGDYSEKYTGDSGAPAAKSERTGDAAGESGRAHRGGTAGDFPEGDLGAVRDQLENIRQGMADAVEEQMKSERMKVDLIANVSHDLKTPLTSIISYVEFLKQEEGLPEHVKDYVRILDEKSERLKNMVQDVFAVSKAASGELPVHMETLDFGKLLRQTLADMDEEIRGSSVTFRTELPEEPVMILADGQRMYRVFQNLFQNALKYSLDGSRVYVTLKAEGKTAVACVKNTSHMELDEDINFTERFFRGDKSRTDGGSGLGLSIAQSFTEACGGQFELEFNADLFIVRVSFSAEQTMR